MNGYCDVGVIGLAVMGAGLARNFASRGLRVAVFNRSPEPGRRLVATHPEARLVLAERLEDFVAALQRPRRIVLMVQAGEAVDAVLASLDPRLDPGDVVVDGGNSHFVDTDRRLQALGGRPWSFMGMGVSGGEEGALKGPSLMPGGDPEAWLRMRPVLEAIAAVGPQGPCVTHCGRGSAGHFTKMVHNGIEYGDMQLIAETALLLRRGLGLGASEAAEVFARWNEGELDSFLVEITAEVLATPDPERPGAALVDAVLDRAGQKGTGRWTVQAAAELGVAVPTLAAAVDARLLSAARDLRLQAARLLPPPPRALPSLSTEDLGAALYAAKIASYTQGFALLDAASRARGYGMDLAEIARVWTAGCILRARMLGSIHAAFEARPVPELLAFAPDFVEALHAREAAWRRVVSAAQVAGLPVPGLSASLAWFDTLRNSFGSASLIQAQRDHFGAHGYERVDRPGELTHSRWGRGERA
jgi:6-phosphogluconate dehydrogenase